MYKLQKVHRVISRHSGELPLREGRSTFTPAGMERKKWEGDVPENSGFTEKPRLAELKLFLNAIRVERDGKTLGVEMFGNVEEDTLTIYTTGTKETRKLYMMPNAWVAKPGELGDGEISVTYNSATSPRLE